MDEGLSPGGLHPEMTSPSDMVGPSPVTSNGTATTEIEDEAADDMHDGDPPLESSRPSTANSNSVITVCAFSWVVAGNADNSSR